MKFNKIKGLPNETNFIIENCKLKISFWIQKQSKISKYKSNGLLSERNQVYHGMADKKWRAENFGFISLHIYIEINIP